jgi:hypothetical protein
MRRVRPIIMTTIMSDLRLNGTPTAWRIASMGWQTSLWSLQHMPLLMGSAVAGALVENLVFGGLADFGLFRVLVDLGLETAITASVAIAIHRLVFLDERDDRWIWQISGQFARFFLWLLVARLDRVVLALLLPAGVSGPPRFLPYVMTVCYAIKAIVFTRCLTLFPAVAIDAAGGGVRGAWRASKGHFWLFFRTIFCVALVPIIIYVGIAIAVMLGGELTGSGWHEAPRYSDWLNTLPDAVLIPMSAVAMAAAASILYRDVAYRPAQ